MSFTIEKRLPMDNILLRLLMSVLRAGTCRSQPTSLETLFLARRDCNTMAEPLTASNLLIRADRAGLDGFGAQAASDLPRLTTRLASISSPALRRYHSLQATLSHIRKNLQYFATYTFGKALGTVATNESDGAAWADPIDTETKLGNPAVRSHARVQSLLQLERAEARARRV